MNNLQMLLICLLLSTIFFSWGNIGEIGDIAFYKSQIQNYYNQWQSTGEEPKWDSTQYSGMPEAWYYNRS